MKHTQKQLVAVRVEDFILISNFLQQLQLACPFLLINMEMQHMIYRSHRLPEQSCRGRDQMGAVVAQWAAQTNQSWTPSTAQRMLRRPRWARGQIIPRLQSPHSVSDCRSSVPRSDLHSERAHPAQLPAWHSGCLRAEAGLAQQKRQCRSQSWQRGAGGWDGLGVGGSADTMWWEKLWKEVLWAHIAASRSTGQNWPLLAAEGSFPLHQLAAVLLKWATAQVILTAWKLYSLSHMVRTA